MSPHINSVSTISKEDQRRIAFAQQLLDSGAMRSVRSDDPAFLSFAVKHGFLKGNETEQECFELYGRLLSDATLKEKSFEFRIGSVLPGGAFLKAMAAMTPKELAALRERVTK